MAKKDRPECDDLKNGYARVSTRPILQQKFFWILFFIAVVVGLFIYGRYLVGENTAIQRAARENLRLTDGWTICSRDSALVTESLVRQRAECALKDSLIDQLRDTITSLRSVLPETVSVLVRAPPETVYVKTFVRTPAYGQGHGLLTLSKGCDCDGLKIWIDGQYAGEAAVTSESNMTPNCEAQGTIGIILIAGEHHVRAVDRQKHRWDFDVNLTEGMCSAHRLVMK